MNVILRAFGWLFVVSGAVGLAVPLFMPDRGWAMGGSFVGIGVTLLGIVRWRRGK